MGVMVRNAALAVVAAVSAVSVAHGASVTATLHEVSPSQIVGVSYNGQALGQAYAGTLNWYGQAGNAGGLTGPFSTFCIDLLQDVYVGSTYGYEVVDLTEAPDPLPPTAPADGGGMGPSNAAKVQKLYALEYDNVGSDHTRAAAFQVALWEMLYETGGTSGVADGNFFLTGVPSALIDLANQFVSAASAPGSLLYPNQLLVLTSPTAQDQIFVGDLMSPEPPARQGEAPVPVPAPAAVAGAVPLLGGLALFRRIRRKAMQQD